MGVFIYDQTGKHINKYASIELEKGKIEFGYIKDAKYVHSKLKELLHLVGTISSQVQWIIQDQNILVRKIKILKTKINEKQTIDKYIKNQFKKTIFFPFQHATFTYHILDEKDDYINLIIYLSDEDLIQDYLDIFEKVNLYQVNFNMFSNIVSTLYYDKNAISLNVMMQESSITNSIVEYVYTIFSSLYECDLHAFDPTRLEDYIEIVSNYYQYYLRKNTKKINEIYIIDFKDGRHIKDQMDLFISNHWNLKVEILDINHLNKELEHEPNIIKATYMASLAFFINHMKFIEFKIKRDNVIARHLYYGFSVAILFFMIMFMNVIPLYNANQTIQREAELNQILDQQREVFENSINIETYTNDELTYNHIYQYLLSLDDTQMTYISDLMSIDYSIISYMSIDIKKKNQNKTLII